MSSSESLPGVLTKTTPRPAPNGMGTGLFATDDFRTGEDVLNIKVPFVAILDTPRLEDTCAGCFGRRHLEDTQQPALRACTGCQTVRYCDKTCQAKDWKHAHSLECRIFRELKPNVLPNNARALLRMVLRTTCRKYDTQELDLFSKLETHMQDIRDRSRMQWERINLTAAAIRTYSRIDELSEETIAGYAAKLDLNSFNLTTALYDRIGLYLHPYAALINHSCDYNSVVGFDGDELFVKAIRPIKKDEQIFISYIDTTNPVTKRQQELTERYYFLCACPKCQRDLKEDDDEDDSQAKQPHISLQDDLISSLIASGRFESAFINAAARYLHADPIVYPQKVHPIRQIHAWALAKLATHLSQEGNDSNNIGNESSVSRDTAPLRNANLNYGYIIWSTLYRMVRMERESCSMPSLKSIVRRAFGEVDGEFKAHGIDPRTRTGEIAAEWKKLDALARARV